MSLFSVFNTAGSALNAETVRLNTTASNLANAESVNGDPSKNIRVLVDKRNVEVVIKGGSIIDFDEQELDARWSHPERVMTYSLDDLTYDTVYGDGPPVGHEVPMWTRDQGKDIATDLRKRELDARAVVDA